MITVDEACHYLGADSTDTEENTLVNRLLDQAYGKLNLLTGTDWKTKASDIADDVIFGMVYMSYYAIRDDSRNTEFLERKIASDITFLQLMGDGEDGS